MDTSLFIPKYFCEYMITLTFFHSCTGDYYFYYSDISQKVLKKSQVSTILCFGGQFPDVPEQYKTWFFNLVKETPTDVTLYCGVRFVWDSFLFKISQFLYKICITLAFNIHPSYFRFCLLSHLLKPRFSKNALQFWKTVDWRLSTLISISWN